jgi:hypothetical protein
MVDMKSVGCVLKLAGDKNVRDTPRFIELSINSGYTHRGGTWVLMRNSTDPELKIGASKGRWTLAEVEGYAGWTLDIVGPKLYVQLELYGLDGDFIERIGCADSITGDAWRQGPPESNMSFTMWYGCA